MKNKIYFLPVILALLLSLSCSKDEEPEVKDFETIGFDTEVLIDKLPEGLKDSDDEYAQRAVDYVESTADWSTFSSQLSPPDNAVKVGKKSTDTYKWTWNYGGGYVLTMWWSYWDDAQKNYWDLDIQYGDGDRYNYLQAWETKNNLSGQVKYNFQWACALDEDDPANCENLFWIYNWNMDENENFTGSLVWEAEDDGFTSSIKYETVVNNDGSGSVKYYFYDELWYHLSWDTQGNGSWFYYYGDQETSGSWTVE